MSERFTIMDIGHRGLPLDEALTELETAVSDCIFHGKVRAIKVIHGHGSGALKRGVREWCKNQTGRFQILIWIERMGPLLIYGFGKGYSGLMTTSFRY